MEPHQSGSVCSSLNNIVVSLGFDAPEKNIPVNGMTLDSREVKDGFLFVAIKGAHSDGRKYIDQAIAAGASAVLAEGDENENKHPVYFVRGLRLRLGEIAARFYGMPANEMEIIGITGTNGKTTCAQLIKQMFDGLGERAATIGTMGYGADLSRLVSTGLTTPDAISCQKILKKFLQQNISKVSMEVSSHALAQGRCEGLRFAGALFTNLSQDHLDYHADMAEYAKTKARLFSAADRKFAVINADDQCGREVILPAVPAEVSCILYGIDKLKVKSVLPENARFVIAKNIEYEANGFTMDIYSSWGEAKAKCALLGPFNVHNVLATVSVLCASGFSLVQVAAHVKNLKPIAGRMQLLSVAGADITVCVDYAHTPDALEKAITATKIHTQGNLITVFGCGGDRDSSKRLQMGLTAESLSDRIVVTSDNPRTEDPSSIINDVLAGLKGSVEVRVDRAEAIDFAIANAEPHDCVLIAGKGHEDYQIIGDRKLPFSDVLVAQQCLMARTSRRAGGAYDAV
ncbi:UDP-N-acetylmuramoylalanyl-D-glutamate--2,6-diaminopimelate ligase [Alteromonadaceae bacterium Bs31]|nr:UDP-N-acetylmuramoylalanyl-D-glutamate--2,6-diaminopimelate ligase [Alteromonadaceae bacterium Bs31]